MKQLSEILEEIADGPAIRFAALISRDGFVIENSSSMGQPEQLAISRVAQLLFAAETVGEELHNGPTRQILVKQQNGLLVVDCLDSNAILITALATEASIPWAKYVVQKYLAEITQRI
jgi:predicted regulator of Ras-like GTPase activity (Roadblock/LC7/MglB family)